MTDAMITARTQRRLQLRARGYMPIPLFGKIPPMKAWQELTVISTAMIELWSKIWPDAVNTGALTRNMPTLDLDIMCEPAARRIEELVGWCFEDRGRILVRIGKAPKRAILFHTNQPFKKITLNFSAPNGSAEKIEFLGIGQQVVIDGIHPETAQPYRWFGGVPWDVAHSELPYIGADLAHGLVEDLARLLTTDFGYTRVPSPPRSIANGRGNAVAAGGEALWKFHLDNIRHGRSLHDSINSLAAALIRSGMQSGAAVHLLAALLELSEASHDERWDARYRDVPRAVDSAVQKYR
jgi:hypothetical protein